MPTITKSRLITAGTIPIKHAWARLPSIGIDRDPAIIDLAYLIAGLVTITQSRLVHCMLQGVKHTDPTEWGNSHLSIGDKFVLAVWWTVSIFKGCSLISFQWLFCHTFQGQLSNILYCWIFWICTKMVFTTYTYNMLFANSLVTYWLYFNDININKLNIHTPCVTALILSECTKSSFQAAWTALSQTAPNIINLDPLLVT